jgi:hypothetical protein
MPPFEVWRIAAKNYNLDEAANVGRTHMLVGQIQIFLAGRETVRRRLNWDGYDENSGRQIQNAVFDQLDLFLEPLVTSI